MPSFASTAGNVLYLIACGAPPASQLPELIKPLQDDGWDVCLIATPSALQWLDRAELAATTGHPVRSNFRRPDEPEFEPFGNAVLVCPLTFNTLNKWALGINDTLALGLLNEALGRSLPIYALPWVNDALATHPAYEGHRNRLAHSGVTFISPPAEILHIPGHMRYRLPPPTVPGSP